MGTGNGSSEFGEEKRSMGEVKCNRHSDVKKGAVIKKRGTIKAAKNSLELTYACMASSRAIHMTDYYTSCLVLPYYIILHPCLVEKKKKADLLWHGKYITMAERF